MHMFKSIFASCVVSLLILVPVAHAAECSMRPATLTGYFTPIASDYVTRPGDIISLDFLKLFVIQWMGITERWGVIGLWDSDGDGRVNLQINLPCPLDAQGQCLVAYDDNQPEVPGTAASNTLAPGTLLRVGGSSGPLYKITDTIGVTQGHDESLLVDIYYGEGEQAHNVAKENVHLNGAGKVCVY